MQDINVSSRLDRVRVSVRVNRKLTTIEEQELNTIDLIITKSMTKAKISTPSNSNNYL